MSRSCYCYCIVTKLLAFLLWTLKQLTRHYFDTGCCNSTTPGRYLWKGRLMEGGCQYSCWNTTWNWTEVSFVASFNSLFPDTCLHFQDFLWPQTCAFWMSGFHFHSPNYQTSHLISAERGHMTMPGKTWFSRPKMKQKCCHSWLT